MKKRIFKEYQLSQTSQEPYGFYFPNDDNPFIIEGWLLGKEKTSYANGLFFLHIKLPNDYPFSPPKVNFKTRIFHIADLNKCICCDCLLATSKWNPRITIMNILGEIRDYLLKKEYKEVKCCVNDFAYKLLKDDPEMLECEIKRYVDRYASYTREDLEKLEKKMGRNIIAFLKPIIPNMEKIKFNDLIFKFNL